jgi:hypothetical protein
MIGRKLIAARARVPAGKLADLSQPMKSFLPLREAPDDVQTS